jgi:hypothetical protein
MMAKKKPPPIKRMPYRYVQNKNSSKPTIQCSHVLSGLYRSGERCTFSSSFVNDETHVGYCGKHYKLLDRTNEDAPITKKSAEASKVSYLRRALDAAQEELNLTQGDYVEAQRRAEAAVSRAQLLASKVETLTRQVAELREQVSQ